MNPAHLEAVTPRENTLRGETLSAINASKSRCPAGHAYDEANTYRGQGRRTCRACAVVKMRRYRQRKAMEAQQR